MIEECVESSSFFSIEDGRDVFTDMVKVMAQYNEKKREIVDAVEKIEEEKKKADGLISKTVNELTTALLMRNQAKAKKYELIEKLKKKKAAYDDEIRALEEKLKELKRETFGAEETPKLYFGSYPKRKNGTPEPLEWDVMRIKGSGALLLSTYIIEHMRYAEELENTPWQNSLIRKWLNERFYSSCFSDEERAMIRRIETANPGNDVYKTAESSNTRDYIFIPSIKDVRRFFNYDEERKAVATQRAVADGVYVDDETKCSYWWLRSNGGNMYNAAAVNFTGYIFEYGFYVNSDGYGIRPALWIDLK